ncbi:hypothetical protein SAMN04489712_10214 [Thermomonospora echinospora]|uniref:Uncharacterized protein n=1 Tax=Thermomonospora echinospora TaxID=1992 RepID=A0A1H5UTF7_9ACTN|nr:hypothetical protein [Thermomonospora echinospora]SEF78286.1 hypothetical protein SAMN04489712_10214 [Thermomonospora echinospora]
MTSQHIQQVIDDLSYQQSLPQRLISAYRGLEVIEYAARKLVFLGLLHRSSTWRDVQRQAVRARGDLTWAPAFPWPIDAPPPAFALALADEQAVVEQLTVLAEGVVLTLVEASALATEVADHRACTVAAIRTCLLQRGIPSTAEAASEAVRPRPH